MPRISYTDEQRQEAYLAWTQLQKIMFENEEEWLDKKQELWNKYVDVRDGLAKGSTESKLSSLPPDLRSSRFNKPQLSASWESA